MKNTKKYAKNAPKKTLRKKPRTNAGSYQWDNGMTFKEKARMLANSGTVLGSRSRRSAFIDDFDRYQSPTERVMDYLRNASVHEQRYYGVYDDLHKPAVKAATQETSVVPSVSASQTSTSSSRKGGRTRDSRLNYDGMSFGDAFAAARRSGAGQFSWRGKSYTTELASEKRSRRGGSASTNVAPQEIAQPIIEAEPLVDVNPYLAPYKDLDALITHNPYNSTSSVPYSFVNPEGAISQGAVMGPQADQGVNPAEFLEQQLRNGYGGRIYPWIVF